MNFSIPVQLFKIKRIPTIILKGNIEFKNVDFTYPHTGIHAIKNFDL